MTETLILYIILWIIAILTVLSFAIWLKKMIKVILWNYVLWVLCFAASVSIDSTINVLSNSWFSNFLSDSKSIIILIVYAILLFLVYHKSKISINIPQDQIMQKSLYLIFVPLTVFSMCLTILIIFLWSDLFNYVSLVNFANWFSQNLYLQTFIIYIPYWLLIHWFLTIFVTSRFWSRFDPDS